MPVIEEMANGSILDRDCARQRRGALGIKEVQCLLPDCADNAAIADRLAAAGDVLHPFAKALGQRIEHELDTCRRGGSGKLGRR